MIQLTITEAATAVRARLDELALTEDMLSSEEMDDRNLVLLVTNLLPEAINSVAMQCRVSLLENTEKALTSDMLEVDASDRRVVVISPDITDYLRFISLKSEDSDMVVTEAVDEATPEGRMQLNKFLRAKHDAPVLVMLQNTAENPKFRYYSLEDEATDAKDAAAQLKSLHYFPRAKISGAGYSIPGTIKTAILDYLTGLCLMTYNEPERANLFVERANDMIK